MKDDVVAKRYAKALYDLGREEGLQDKFLGDMEALVSVLDSSEEFRALMESPLYDITLKKRILGQVITQAKLTKYTENFFNILLEKDRFEYLASILDAYRQILDEASGRVRAAVTSAMELDKEEIERISGALKKVVKKDVDLDVSVDPSLIGGLIAEVEGMVYDGSVKTQISRLKQSLKGEI
ncbi:MAG TPA: ATP synthase F1 subunit delta [Desulfomonilia bacterium]|nr:ATP synthase F1 subunit delta [Thermodesulfobacteriota bacterium]HWR68311.1 ATP synthase F1 subunit delta [Desulfomonilia bacterium]